MDNIKKRMIFSTLLCLVPIVIGLIIYSKLPDEVAIHFDSSGTPNGHMSKFGAVFFLPVIMAVVNLISQVSIENDPKKKNQLPLMKNFFIWLVPILSITVQSFIYLYAMDDSINTSKAIVIVVGIIFVLVGNYLPKCRQNYTIGIKLPWTLNDSDNWNKTHRLAGFIWIIGGLVAIVSSLLNITDYIIVAIILVMVIIPTIYSFVLYKKSNND